MTVSASDSENSTEVLRAKAVSATQEYYFYHWIKILSGEEVPYSAFPYKSGNELRKQDDMMLEDCHNYIQVFFPNLLQSHYHQKNLFINSCKDEWEIALNNNPTLLGKIQIQMKLNFVRMLKFWEFNVESREIDSDSKNISIERIFVQPDTNPNYFNNQKVTRVLHSLRLFGLHEEHQKFLQVLNSHHSYHSSLSYWNNTQYTPLLTDLLKSQN